ncbi:restriction endonuclease subunit S [Streptomyces coelicoflavus]|uniref:restriction endonuclease subunit S n=1 Tax=Streptomyces coelicoflavus TaxID=285562 RepID=UPI003F4A80BD
MTTDSGAVPEPGGSGAEGDVTGGLPAGWVRATLGELGEWFGGGTPSKKNPEFWTDGTIPWLSPKDMGEDVLAGTQDLIHESALGASPVKLLPAGSVAIVVRSGILERKVPVAYVPFEVTLNQDMKAVVPYKGIDGRWLAAVIASQEQRILADCRKAGTTVASLEVSRLMEVRILVPPSAEQHRIVAKLDDQLAHVEAGEGSVQSALLDLSRLEAVSLEAALKEIDPKSSLVGDLIREPLSNGKSVRTLNDGFPVLRLHSVHGEFVDLSIRKGGDWGEVDPAAYKVQHEDFLIIRGNGNLSLVGRGALVPRSGDEVAFPDTLIRVRLDRAKISPDFLNVIWDSRNVRSQIESQARTTAGIYKINQDTLSRIEIPCPPLAEQGAVVRRVQEARGRYAPLRTAVEKIVSEALELRATLLHAAFTGTLVPQDPDDEPASVLLDRIRAQRADKAKPARRKRAPRKTTPAAPQISGRPVTSGTQEAPSL